MRENGENQIAETDRTTLTTLTTLTRLIDTEAILDDHPACKY
jgi:hypothetical protein